MRIQDKNRVRVIGKLIRIYREEKRHNTQNEYTLLRFCDGICTINTLKRIESGECSRSDEVYDALLAKLKLRFDYFPDVDIAVEKMMDPLYNAIEYYQIDKVIECCNIALRLLDRVKDYVFYSELYEIFTDVQKYYKEDVEISVNKMNHYRNILKIIEPPYNIAIKIIIYTRASIISVNDVFAFEKIFKELDLIHENFLSIRMLLLHYYYLTGKFVSMAVLIKELEVAFIQTNNKIRLIDVYNYSIYLYTEIEKSERENIILKIDKLACDKSIPAVKIVESYASIAWILHAESNYKRALDCFNKILLFEINPYLPYLIYMADCQRHLNIPIEIPELKPSILKKYSTHEQLMYNYYRDYNLIKPFAKQIMIVKKIAPYLKDKTFISIFAYEINRLAEETNSYKNIYIYNKLVENHVHVQ